MKRAAVLLILSMFPLAGCDLPLEDECYDDDDCPSHCFCDDPGTDFADTSYCAHEDTFVECVQAE